MKSLKKTVVSLTAHKNRKEKRERREIWERLQATTKTTEKNIDWFALVTYTKAPHPEDGSQALFTQVDYYVREQGDQFMLPEMFAHKVKGLIG